MVIIRIFLSIKSKCVQSYFFLHPAITDSYYYEHQTLENPLKDESRGINRHLS